MITWILSILLLVNPLQPNNDTALDEYLQQQLAEYKRFEYEVVRLPRDLESLSDDRVVIKQDQTLRISNGYAYVPIELVLGDGVSTRSMATLKVSLYKDVYIALRDIKRGEVLSKGDFFIEEKDIAELVTTPMDIAEPLMDMRASTNIRQDLVLQENMVERKPIVKRGDRITAFVVVGNVSISFMANAREEGYKGKRIRIVRDDDKRIFKAEIIDPKNVKIIE